MGSERMMTGWNEETDFLNGELSMESSSSSPSTSSPPSSVVGGLNYIIHYVSKYDTLAGVAIKYGVEVADIKRLNGLITDLQMFALKTLQIPLPGRHSPSPILFNGETPPRPCSSNKTPSSCRDSSLFDSFQSLKSNSYSNQKVTPAMNSLQGYYGLRSSDKKSTSEEGFEMAVYNKEKSCNFEDGVLSHLSLEAENGNSDRWFENLIRRRQKCEADFRTPEKLLKEENNSGNLISVITGKGLALRLKSSRTVSGGLSGETCGPNSIPFGVSSGLTGVRKSSSTPSLQDPDNGALWTTSKWNLKSDVSGKPMFDGLRTGRKKKAALD